MNLVQRLTGSTSLSDQTNAAISPAARFASIEMTKSPMGKGQVVSCLVLQAFIFHQAICNHLLLLHP
ncbi:hypothetical protein V6N13_125909 [Hibiscus sabdariffa]